MAISNYSELQTAMANQSARSDLTAYLPNMIVLAEARLLRDLKKNSELHTTTTLVADAQSEALPGDFGGMVRARAGANYPTLDYLPPNLFHSHKNVDNSGRPIAYTIEGNNILFAPSPDDSYTITYTYVQKLDIATDTTNRLLTIYPDIYLWACMVELADFIHDTEMTAKYMTRYQEAKDAMMQAAHEQIGTPRYVSAVP